MFSAFCLFLIFLSRAAQVVPAIAHWENTDDGDDADADADRHGGTDARAPPGRDKYGRGSVGAR